MSELTVQQKVENAIKWIDTLDTTDLKQGKDCLGDSENGYCCLAIANIVHGWKFKRNRTGLDKYNDLGLISIYGIPSAYSNYSSLVTINDDFEKSFKEISVILKESSEQYFIPEVAEKLKEHYA